MQHNKSQQKKHRRRNPYLFMLLAVLLIIGIIIFGLRAMNGWEIYEKEAAVTPVPTPTVRPIAVTPDMTLVTNTPAPTVTPAFLANGSQGEMVIQLQLRLQQLGFYTGTVDGQFGNGTKNAVLIFQKQHGLEADGVAGQQTMAMLYSSAAQYIVITPTPDPYQVAAEEIPLLVNAQNKLPDGYEPQNLVRVKDVGGSNMLYASSDVQGVYEAVVALNEMVTAAKADGIGPWKVREGYRTLKYQQQIFDNYVNRFMENNGMSRSQAVSATKQTVADPGCSEHHTGLAFDLNANNPDVAFVDTAQYVWLNKHCWEYGFIMRYTDDKQDITGILGEEWHVRYVGKEHSIRMRDSKMCLEEYAAWLNAQ